MLAPAVPCEPPPPLSWCNETIDNAISFCQSGRGIALTESTSMVPVKWHTIQHFDGAGKLFVRENPFHLRQEFDFKQIHVFQPTCSKQPRV